MILAALGLRRLAVAIVATLRVVSVNVPWMETDDLLAAEAESDFAQADLVAAC